MVNIFPLSPWLNLCHLLDFTVCIWRFVVFIFWIQYTKNIGNSTVSINWLSEIQRNEVEWWVLGSCLQCASKNVSKTTNFVLWGESKREMQTPAHSFLQFETHISSITYLSDPIIKTKTALLHIGVFNILFREMVTFGEVVTMWDMWISQNVLNLWQKCLKSEYFGSIYPPLFGFCVCVVDSWRALSSKSCAFWMHKSEPWCDITSENVWLLNFSLFWIR